MSHGEIAPEFTLGGYGSGIAWRLTESHLRVLKLIAKQEGLDTRLQEASTGDLQFVPTSLCERVGLDTGRMVLDVLAELESARCLECRSVVDSWDSSKYLLQWRLTPRGRQLLQK